MDINHPVTPASVVNILSVFIDKLRISGDFNHWEEVSIDKQVACEECPRWLKMTEVA